MRFKVLAFLAALPLTAIALPPAPAQAAPQILGLIASAEPVPMTCVDGTCTAELSSFCLQQHRDTPNTGTLYRPARGTHVTLTVTGPDGVNRRLPVEAALSFASLRQYTAVRVSLPEKMVRQLGDGAATLSVGPMASIIPVAIEDDPKPLSLREIARYTGPLRAAAEGAIERDSSRVQAMRILNQMINRLPEYSSAGIEKMGALWKQTVGRDVSAGTQKYMKRAVINCRETLRTGMLPSLRSCLGYQHDYLSGESTNNVWRAMKPGS